MKITMTTPVSEFIDRKFDNQYGTIVNAMQTVEAFSYIFELSMVSKCIKILNNETYQIFSSFSNDEFDSSKADHRKFLLCFYAKYLFINNLKICDETFELFLTEFIL